MKKANLVLNILH